MKVKILINLTLEFCDICQVSNIKTINCEFENSKDIYRVQVWPVAKACLKTLSRVLVVGYN